MTSSLQATEAAAQDSQMHKGQRERVTLAHLENLIRSDQYFYPLACQHMTICALELENGFILIGKSAPADAENFDAALGRKFAYEDALRQAWQLEGYLLRQRLDDEREAGLNEEFARARLGDKG